MGAAMEVVVMEVAADTGAAADVAADTGVAEVTGVEWVEAALAEDTGEAITAIGTAAGTAGIIIIGTEEVGAGVSMRLITMATDILIRILITILLRIIMWTHTIHPIPQHLITLHPTTTPPHQTITTTIVVVMDHTITAIRE